MSELPVAAAHSNQYPTVCLDYTNHVANLHVSPKQPRLRHCRRVSARRAVAVVDWLCEPNASVSFGSSP
jgi:hypothetical protein